VHGNLKLADDCINYDMGNACLGFVNAMASVGMMIDAGLLDYGLIVDGENATRSGRGDHPPIESTGCNIGIAFRDQFATLTLGSGAVAMVVCRRDLSTTGHTMANGSVTRAATRHSRLCLGQRDQMTADAAKVLVFGVELGQKDLGSGQPHLESTGAMREIDAYMPHQVSQRNMDVLNEKLGLTPEKQHLNFPHPGQHRSGGGAHHLDARRPNPAVFDRATTSHSWALAAVSIVR
jgi:3-oxoacyl-[acyl-carrier-protein] synthase III